MEPTHTISKTGFCWTRSIDHHGGEVRAYYKNAHQVMVISIDGQDLGVSVVWSAPNHDPRGKFAKKYWPLPSLTAARDMADMAGIGFVAAAGKIHSSLPEPVAAALAESAPSEAVQQ